TTTIEAIGAGAQRPNGGCPAAMGIDSPTFTTPHADKPDRTASPTPAWSLRADGTRPTHAPRNSRHPTQRVNNAGRCGARTAWWGAVRQDADDATVSGSGAAAAPASRLTATSTPSMIVLRASIVVDDRARDVAGRRAGPVHQSLERHAKPDQRVDPQRGNPV